MKIDVNELRAIVDGVFAAWLDLHREAVVEVPDNLYWTVVGDDAYEQAGDAPEPTLGSLSDDWEFLEKGRADGLCSGHFEHAAPILKWLSERGP